MIGIRFTAKPLIPILGGLLTFESEWSPALGPSFEKALMRTLMTDGSILAVSHRTAISSSIKPLPATRLLMRISRRRHSCSN